MGEFRPQRSMIEATLAPRAPWSWRTAWRVVSPSSASSTRRTAWAAPMRCAVAALLWPTAVLAQAINVVAPTLPPRAAAAPGAPTQAAPAMGTSNGPTASTPGYGAAGTTGTSGPAGYGVAPGATAGAQAPGYGGAPAYGGTPTSGGAPAHGGATAPAYGSTPGYGGAPGYGSGAPAAGGFGGGSSARAPAAPASALAGRGGYAPNPYGSAPPSNDAAIAAVPVARSSAPGACRAEPSPDRQSVTLLGADALPRQHVPLGEFRVQQVIHSPDGRWAIALTKLRGQPQFAAMALDLARCAATHTIDLPAAADDARFDADEAVLTLGGRERRMKLADVRVR